MDRVELVGVLRQATGVALVFQPLPLEEAGLEQRGRRVVVQFVQLGRPGAVVGQVQAPVQMRLALAPAVGDPVAVVRRNRQLVHQSLAGDDIADQVQRHLVQLGAGYGWPSMVWKRKPASAARARHWARSAIRMRCMGRSAAVAAAGAAARAGVAEATTAGGDRTVRFAGDRGQAGLARADATGGVQTTATARGRARPTSALVLVGRRRRRRRTPDSIRPDPPDHPRRRMAPPGSRLEAARARAEHVHP
ncbi:hypothetical protein G6F59_014628 [Rhizopus arrhizus]|nr:hypothetical protein G6F59_014628 [Rhizopus arrhizus]